MTMECRRYPILVGRLPCESGQNSGVDTVEWLCLGKDEAWKGEFLSIIEYFS